MIKPSPSDTCQTCQEPATNFHPYVGFCCFIHLQEAQAQFNFVSNIKHPEPFNEINK